MSGTSNILKDVEFNMDKTLSIFESMVNEYHNPTGFIANADSLIQALRNFTFYLQSKKNDIDNFDVWYTPWQELMRANPYMRFIVDMRNSIVKQGINTAKSHALIILYTDYTQTLLEKRMDIYSTTNEIKQEITEQAIKQPILKHATGDIQRLYIFNYAKKDDLEVVDTLFYCLFFIKKMFEDFENFIKTGKVQETLPKVIAPWLDMSDFAITFRVKDGNNLDQISMRIDRDDDAIEKYKQQYGDINLKHDINSVDPLEQLRANIEYAQQSRNRFNELLPVLKYYSTKSKSWEVMFPVFTSRAEKILFWENFSDLVVRDKVSKIYFTVDAWSYDDLEKGMAAIHNGEEISSLPDLKETLLAYYLDKTGKIIIAKSPYSRGSDGKIMFQDVDIKNDKPANNAMFTAVFKVWGVKDAKNSQSNKS